jgi:hypothetical protein
MGRSTRRLVFSVHTASLSTAAKLRHGNCAISDIITLLELSKNVSRNRTLGKQLLAFWFNWNRTAVPLLAQQQDVSANLGFRDVRWVRVELDANGVGDGGKTGDAASKFQCRRVGLHVGPVTKHLRRLEFVDERENVAMILAQQFPQMRAAIGVALVALGFAHRAGGLERLGNLVVVPRDRSRRRLSASG